MLRDYQQKLSNDISNAWNTHTNVLAVAPTGSGKTVLFCHKIMTTGGYRVAIAHRQELVGQISLTLARNGIEHRVIGGPSIVTTCSRIHVIAGLTPMINQRASVVVASVDTLIRRPVQDWYSRVALWITDEAHHITRDNKWGTAIKLFPHAKGLGVTATPMRADGQGLGRHASGVFDVMLVGPSMQSLIDDGHLTPFRIFAPPATRLHLEDAWITASGDYSPSKLKPAVAKAAITGDAVDHYLRLAPGKLGVTFCIDVDAAAEMTAAYNRAGVPAALVTAQTPDIERATLSHRLAQGDIKQLVNVDIFGEGYDLPAIEVVSFLRPTASYGLFVQQFGRGLRPLFGKTDAIIIDHVGNCLRHGLPVYPVIWTLDDREKRSKSSATVMISVCPACFRVYERIKRTCPHCDHTPIPTRRDGPEHVDGDLQELDAATMRTLHNDIIRVGAEPVIPWGATREVAGAIRKRHRERLEAQTGLRQTMKVWDGAQQLRGYNVSESQRLFWLLFGVDVARAQVLGKKDANELQEKIACSNKTL